MSQDLLDSIYIHRECCSNGRIVLHAQTFLFDKVCALHAFVD